MKKNHFKILLEMSLVLAGVVQDKNVSFHTWKDNDENCKGCQESKACCSVFNMPFGDEKPTIMLFDGDGTYCFV